MQAKYSKFSQLYASLFVQEMCKISQIHFEFSVTFFEKTRALLKTILHLWHRVLDLDIRVLYYLCYLVILLLFFVLGRKSVAAGTAAIDDCSCNAFPLSSFPVEAK